MLLLLLLLLASFSCFERILASGPTLPADEVIALQRIAATLGKKDWNFSVDPCSGQQNWATPNARLNFENAVTCNCSFANNTVCHVVSIVLKAQSLPGSAPPELTKLPFLQEIDLTRNYLNGTIPPEWGSMQLVNISLNGNRISGPIPKELGNISTLVNLTLEYNQLSGTIPPELGNLTVLAKLFLTSNYLTGELPEELAKLTNLKDFRIGDNQFLGSIPNFIQNWTNLQKLVSQASGLNGPIPSGIASLTNLYDLRITDLNGSFTASFPPLSGATNLQTLILRSCSISGPLPDYLSSMTQLDALDLSFNKLTGSIPISYSGILTRANFIYLTGNFLSGAVPDWMINNGKNIDLSYNNLSGNAVASNCQYNNLNLFASTSEGNTSGIVSCLRNYQCPQNWFSFHINCGGREVKVDDRKIYQDDTDAAGPSKFFQSSSNWAFSSTGHFLDDDRKIDLYICTNSSSISGNNPELYTDARLSPLSLTYYGFCLLNGNYTVNLHFAEIMFTNDTTYSSLGRRFFDIYIQGKLVKKDFNIEDEAGGVNKPILLNFTAVVNERTLEIHFRWAGKGTDGIPTRGVYGPLISAISVDPDFTPPPEGHGSSLSAGAVVGIVIGVLFTVFVGSTYSLVERLPAMQGFDRKW